MTPPNRPRAHPRLQYPPSTRPSLILESGSLNVVDLSERGLRYIHDGGPEPPVGTRLEGILQLSSGETLPIRGTVVRVVHPHGSGGRGVIEVAAHLTDLPIPRRVIQAERQSIQSPPKN